MDRAKYPKAVASNGPLNYAVKILEIQAQAQIEALVTYDGQACFHRPAIAIYNTLPVVTPDGGEYKANGDRKGLELSPF
jgi:hypothetical protein